MPEQNVKELIPHRDPFLFVDELESVTETTIVGHRVFHKDEFFFPGHFPSWPIVPGVILVEAMAQCGGAGVVSWHTEYRGNLFVLASIEKAKFRNPVVPGDRVRFEISNIHVDHRALRQKGKAFVNDKVSAEAQWLCMMKKT